MSETQALYRLQSVDSELDARRKRAQAIKATLEQDAELRQAQHVLVRDAVSARRIVLEKDKGGHRGAEPGLASFLQALQGVIAQDLKSLLCGVRLPQFGQGQGGVGIVTPLHVGAEEAGEVDALMKQAGYNK